MVGGGHRTQRTSLIFINHFHHASMAAIKKAVIEVTAFFLYKMVASIRPSL